MNLLGQWRIIEMDLWDREAIELLGPDYFERRKDRTGATAPARPASMSISNGGSASAGPTLTPKMSS